MQIGDVVAQYLVIREKRDEIKKRHAEELQPLNEALYKVEMFFLDYFQKNGADNLSVRGVGTVYRKTNVSATVADWDAFRDFVVEHEAWHMLEQRASKTAVRDFVEEQHAPPPGVDYKTDFAVSIRKDSQK